MIPAVTFILCVYLPLLVIGPIALIELDVLPDRHVRHTAIEMSPEWYIGRGLTE